MLRWWAAGGRWLSPTLTPPPPLPPKPGATRERGDSTLGTPAWAALPALIRVGCPEEEGTAKHRRRGLTHLSNCPSSLKTPLS